MEYRRAAQACVAAPSVRITDLRSAYLERWGTYGDINLGNTLRQLSLTSEVGG